MPIYPKSLKEAEQYRYGAWSGNPNGLKYNNKKCAAEVKIIGGMLYKQCGRENGHGPSSLFCSVHSEEASENIFKEALRKNKEKNK